MFAIVRTGGKQYRVAPGDKIVVEKLDGNAGDSITLSYVLLAGDGSELQSTDGLTVAAEIVAQAKGDKVVVFKKRRRHNYRRKKGHRQQHTILRIVSVGGQQAQSGGDAAAAKPKKARETAASPATTAGETTSFEGVAPADAGTTATHEADTSTPVAAPAKGNSNEAAPAATQTEE